MHLDSKIKRKLMMMPERTSCIGGKTNPCPSQSQGREGYEEVDGTGAQQILEWMFKYLREYDDGEKASRGFLLWWTFLHVGILPDLVFTRFSCSFFLICDRDAKERSWRLADYCCYNSQFVCKTPCREVLMVHGWLEGSKMALESTLQRERRPMGIKEHFRNTSLLFYWLFIWKGIGRGNRSQLKKKKTNAFSGKFTRVIKRKPNCLIYFDFHTPLLFSPFFSCFVMFLTW